MNKKYVEGMYFCIGCRKNFVGRRSEEWVDAVICPSCMLAVNVVKFSHPFVSMFKK
jgi:DNA-directed RNA polymerase subunit RPC12/RpoP